MFYRKDGTCSLCFLILLTFLVIKNITSASAVFNLLKRNSLPDIGLKHSTKTKQIKQNYDEYPVVVPKRAAILLDRLMVALHHALEDDKNDVKNNFDYNENGKYLSQQHEQKTILQFPKIILRDRNKEGKYDVFSSYETEKNYQESNPDDILGIGLYEKSFQRRAHDEDASAHNTGRVYWRCYFNAVACF